MYIYAGLSDSLIAKCKKLGMHPYVIERYAEYYRRKVKVSRLGRRANTDSEISKVYDSEFSFIKKANIKKFKDIKEAEQRFKQITRSKLWEQLTGGKKCRLELNTRLTSYGGMSFPGGRIELSKCGLDEYTLIHELAHQTRNSMHHGVQFRINLLKLVSRFMGTETAKLLKGEFKKRKLKLSIPQPRSPESWYKSYQHMEMVRESL